MRMVYGVDETPWLRGWPPLMDWLRSNGLDPTVITRFELCPDAPEIAVTEFVLDAKGQRQLAPVPPAHAHPTANLPNQQFPARHGDV